MSIDSSDTMIAEVSNGKCVASLLTHKSIEIAIYFRKDQRPLLGTVRDVQAIQHCLVLHFAKE